MNKSIQFRSLGFTLIEVLVSLAVFSAVLSLVLFGLEQGRLTLINGNSHNKVLSELEKRQFWLSRMFIQANSSLFSVEYGVEVPYLLGTADSIAFISDSPVINGPGTYSFVKLNVEDSDSGKSLKLYEWSNADPYYGLPQSDSTAKSFVIMEHLTKAYWEYYLDVKDKPSAYEIRLRSFHPRYHSLWGNVYDSRLEEKLPKKVRFVFEKNGKSYVWVFNMHQYSLSADQNESLVLQ